MRFETGAQACTTIQSIIHWTIEILSEKTDYKFPFLHTSNVKKNDIEEFNFK